MKFNRSILILILVLPAFITSCDEGGITPINCIKRWVATLDGSTTASVSGGSLNLSAPTLNLLEITTVISKGTLTGDFELAADFENFNGGSNFGAYLSLNAYSPISGNFNNIRILVGNVTTAGVGPLQIGVILDSAGTDTSGASGRYANISTTSGRFILKRASTLMTLQASSGAEVVTISGNYTSNPLIFGFSYGTNFQPVSGNPSVNVTACTITGATSSGNSDQFDCNSLE